MSQSAIADDFAERRLERLERQFRRAQYILSGALAAYESLRAVPGVNDIQVASAWQRVRRAREQMNDIQCTIEFVEDYESMYGSRSVESL